jgi:transposase
MGRLAVLQEVRIMRFEDVYGRYFGGRLKCEEAAELLGVSVSTFGRWRRRYEADGADGLYDRRLGRISGRRAPVDQVDWVVETFRTRYFDFTVKHFHERLVRDHGFTRSYTWLKNTLQGAGVVRRAAKRSAHRKKRARRPLPGMMLFQDGSTHRWLTALDRDLDLIATIDDATGEVYSAFLVDEEGTMSSFQGLHETITAQGLFSSLYTDRGSHYFLTPKAGGKVDKDNPTQVGRALAQLGIQHIASYSPEARGRMERLFGTLQGRWPQELRLAGIKTIEAANRFIRERLMAEHNARFAVPAAEDGSAFVAYVGRDLADILCVQEARTVGNDNCVTYRRLSLQIPPDRHRHHYVKATVRVHEYPDGGLAVFHGPRRLARYAADGRPLTEEMETTTNRSAA